MAIQIDNNYNSTRHIADFLGESNPWALITNAVKLKGLERGSPACNDYVPQFDYALNSGAGTITLTPTHGSQPTMGVLDYYKWVIRDHSTGEAFGAVDLANPLTPVVIDVSGLNASDNWDLVFSSGVDRNFGGPCRVAYTSNIPAGSLAASATASLKFLAELQAQVNGVVVAGGAIALGALAIGADNKALTVLSNLGVLPNKISNVVISGTGLRPGYVPPVASDDRFPALNNFTEDIELLQTASAGATVTVDIYENDSLAITTTFDITFTVV